VVALWEESTTWLAAAPEASEDWGVDVGVAVEVEVTTVVRPARVDELELEAVWAVAVNEAWLASETCTLVAVEEPVRESSAQAAKVAASEPATTTVLSPLVSCILALVRITFRLMAGLGFCFSNLDGIVCFLLLFLNQWYPRKFRK
jgi:hypothetical protein